MAAPPGLMAAAPGYDAGNIGRLTTFQLDNLQVGGYLKLVIWLLCLRPAFIRYSLITLLI